MFATNADSARSHAWDGEVLVQKMEALQKRAAEKLQKKAAEMQQMTGATSAGWGLFAATSEQHVDSCDAGPETPDAGSIHSQLSFIFTISSDVLTALISAAGACKQSHAFAFPARPRTCSPGTSQHRDPNFSALPAGCGPIR
jgi:hypothetical protein